MNRLSLCVPALIAIGLVLSVDGRAQCTGRTITCGNVITDSLSPSGSCIIDGFPTATYVITGVAGQTLSLRASNSSGIDMFMTLFDSTGRTVATSYLDEPVTIDATLPTSGQYKITINLGNPHLSATFTLTVTCIASTNPPPTTCSYTATVKIGDTVSGQLTTADATCGNSKTYSKAYKLPVAAGDAFELTYSPNFAPYIEVDGPDKSGAFRYATSGSVTTAYVAPTTGNVTIWVGSNTTTPVTGTFVLQTAPIQLPTCGRVRVVKH